MAWPTKIYGAKFTDMPFINPQVILPCGGKKGKKNNLDRDLSHKFGRFFLTFFYSFEGFLGFYTGLCIFFVFSFY
jgi:hypothetical protein